MALKKNNIIQLDIESCSLSGSGIGHHDGMAVFVPAAAAGDRLLVSILKVKGNCAFGKINKILSHSPDRTENDCPAFPRCGGCVFRHIGYDSELEIKASQVRENLRRIGHIDITPEKIIGAENDSRYRNKAQFPVRRENEVLKMGFFASRSHRVIDCRSCRLQPEVFETILAVFSDWITRYNIATFDESVCRGLLRHIYIREAFATGEICVCIVANSTVLPHSDELISTLTEAVPKITGIVLNINTDDTNVILGKKCVTLYGNEYITDILCGLRFRISPLSFYQVNPRQAERLYEKAAEYAGLTGHETVLDLYCGAGTIGLTMAKNARKIIGVEIVPEAVEDAKINAHENNIENAEFICADASEAAVTLKSRNIVPDVVIVDPPRKGCSPELLKTVSDMSPEKIVYVSCDSATLSRDCAVLKKYGYILKKVTPVDMFPRTSHVEAVALMSKDR